MPVNKKAPTYFADGHLYESLSKAAIWDALCSLAALNTESYDVTIADRQLLTAALKKELVPILGMRGDTIPKILR